MPPESSGHVIGRRRGVVAALALSAAALVAASPASAGTYTAVSCTQDGQAPAPETAGFEATPGTGWAGQDRCGAEGLMIGSTSFPTEAYSAARWVISAPAGLRFLGGNFSAYAEGQTTEHRPRYLYRPAGGSQLIETGPLVEYSDGPALHSWLQPNPNSLAADQLVLEQRCTAAGGCRDGWVGLVYARDLTFSIEDVAPPTIQGLSGPLMEQPAQRGTQLISIGASDQGGGVRQVELRVNGERVAVKDSSCAIDGAGNALRLSPCPASTAADFVVDTTASPFREGKNSLEVCASDYAQEGERASSFAEEGCVAARAYVDNSCGVSAGPAAADIRFGFTRRGKQRSTVGYGARPRVVARLADAADEPIGGGTVCVSSRDRVGSAKPAELAEIETDARGQAALKLPKGASREVKLTYWADEEEVEMRTVRLSVRARPRLSVLSKRKLSDGGRVRFRVKLAGPYRAGRRVAVQALAPAGWLDFPGCTGRTSRKGYFRCAYGFREQSGNVEYRFRAIAPRQPGYPYLQGRTPAKSVVVRD